MFGSSHIPTQSQALSSMAILPLSYLSTARNSSVSSFSGSTATENTLGSNQSTPNLQQSQPSTSSSASAQPSSSQHQRERPVLVEVRHDCFLLLVNLTMIFS
jgi:hypothetical protein